MRCGFWCMRCKEFIHVVVGKGELRFGGRQGVSFIMCEGMTPGGRGGKWECKRDDDKRKGEPNFVLA